MTSGILGARPDWIGVIEAAYAPAKDDESWARGVVDAARTVFRCSDRTALQIVVHDADFIRWTAPINVATSADYERAVTLPGGERDTLGPEIFRNFFYPQTTALTHLEIDPLLSRAQQLAMDGYRASLGVVDMMGVVVHPSPGTVLVLSNGLDRRSTPSKNERLRLAQVGLHLEAAYRLRSHPEVVKGVLSLKGKRGDGASDALPDEALGEQARRIERSLSRKGRSKADEALELWTALVSGRFSLVSRHEGATRRYLVLENGPRSQAMRALTKRELDVLTMSARGMSTKLVSYGLGLAPSTVSSLLGRAASKLGLSTRLELLRLAATLAHDPRFDAKPATLTEAEAEVLALLREGMSNVQIARLRSRSVRTVANQVASLLRKTQSPSRRAFVADAHSPVLLDPPPREPSE